MTFRKLRPHSGASPESNFAYGEGSRKGRCHDQDASAITRRAVSRDSDQWR